MCLLLYKAFIPCILTFISPFFCIVKYLDKGRIEINLKVRKANTCAIHKHSIKEEERKQRTNQGRQYPHSTIGKYLTIYRCILLNMAMCIFTIEIHTKICRAFIFFVNK